MGFLFVRTGWRRLLLGATCLLTACVDADYDLNKELDWTIGVGGEELSLPFGTTEQIPLERILKTESAGLLQADEQGNYRLYKQESFSWEVPRIDPVTLRVAPHVFDPMTLLFQSEPLSATEAGSGIRLSAEVDERAEESIDAALPAQIRSIDWVMFRQPVYADLSIRVSGDVASIRQLRFEDFRVIFPEYLCLKETGAHEVSIDETFSPVQGYERRFEVERLLFTQNPVQESALHLSVPIRLKGRVVVAEREAEAALPQQIVLEPVLTLTEMPIGRLQGQFDPQVEPSSKRVDLSEVPDFLQGEEVVLDVEPRVALEVENTLGMALTVDWQATPWQHDAPIQEGVNEVRFTIDAAEMPGVATASRRWLATSEQGMPSGYRYVEASHLPQLVRKVPDFLDFQFQVQPDASQPQQLDLSVESYRLSGSYALEIPLSFGPALRLCYRDTIRDLQKELGEVIDKVNSLEIHSEATSTIPLELRCRAIPVDTQGQPLEGVEVSAPEIIQAGGVEGEAVTSAFNVTIRETASGALARLDALILEVSGDGQPDVAYVPLNESQYLQFALTCKVPGGLHLNLDDL